MNQQYCEGEYKLKLFEHNEYPVELLSLVSHSVLFSLFLFTIDIKKIRKGCFAGNRTRDLLPVKQFCFHYTTGTIQTGSQRRVSNIELLNSQLIRINTQTNRYFLYWNLIQDCLIL